MQRASTSLILLIMSAALLQAQRPGGGFHSSAGSMGSSHVAASNSAVHFSSDQGNRTGTDSSFPGHFDGHRYGRPYRHGHGSVWLPWSYPYWGDDGDDFSYFQSQKAPPQATSPAVEYREPAQPAPPKVIEVTQSKEAATAKLQPATVFVLTDGEWLESHDYLLTASSLRIEVDRQQRIISVNKVNIDATLAANHERGIELIFPHNSGTVFLGF
jgi:hypothetical protein